MNASMHDALEQAARQLQDAEALLVCAGAGMGVDSGLPDFRGSQGFWQAYPALRASGIVFHEIANPAAFEADPLLAWGFYGHRLQLYRNTVPHAGFGILRELAANMPGGVFVFTSNVDGQFQRAGFAEDRIVECHGSIHRLQCTRPCSDATWAADAFVPVIDAAACRLRSAPPTCPQCGALARPNILMFNDGAWITGRTDAQYARQQAWRQGVRKLVVVEIGAGVDIPSVRRMSEVQDAPIVRINPRAPQLGRHPGVAISLTGLEALSALQSLIYRKL
ncbi:Sir2 family NAD-dependent protein deacetylase [Massilia sp. Mn16-1_5]|uniref:SIR2 family NAD-dependent protein deacylase n=1 Tax=Massilia sp. Mn16-1_5 TaxID=2079199 RepID=UPI00109E8A5E|nr:Sir2 family NAD-dependent protein deacetylase [Massilia sp. Mn16-1_5]THC40099.1 NAD-dependent deacetylase [Massilia sp. Mn16-1_5]